MNKSNACRLKKYKQKYMQNIDDNNCIRDCDQIANR